MKDNEIIIFSRNLRFIKGKYKLTQKQMAKICGIGVPSMSKLLNNQLPPRVGVECLFRLSYYLNIDIKDLFCENFFKTL